MAYNFDDFVNGAKSFADKAVSKANEAVDYSKTQLDRAQLRGQIKEKFCELGKLCYNMHKTDADETGRMKIVIGEINALEIRLNEADKAVNLKKPRVCPNCGAKNSVDSAFCCKCGGKIS